MKKLAITIMALALLTGFCRVQGSSPPWGGDEHYTFGDEDPPFAEGIIFDTASVDIIGGTFGALHSFEYSHVAMFDGVGNRLWAHDFSTVDLYGGMLDNLAGFDEAEITLFVETYTFEPSVDVEYDGIFTGIWAYDAGYFDILLDAGTLPHINIVVVPEPGTVILFGVPWIFLMRNRKQLNNRKV